MLRSAAESFAARVTLHVRHFFRRQRVREFHSLTPLIYKSLSSMGAIMKGSMLLGVLTPAWSADHCRGPFRHNLPLSLRESGICLAVQGPDRIGVLSVHPDHLEPFLRHRRSAVSEGPTTLLSIRCCQDNQAVLRRYRSIRHAPTYRSANAGFLVSFFVLRCRPSEGRIDAAWARWGRPWDAGGVIFRSPSVTVAEGSYMGA